MSNSIPHSGECQACLQDGVELVTLSCQHASYCADCTVEQFRIIREITRPQCPLCNGEITLNSVKSILPEDLYAEIKAKLLEFEIPGPSRLYCPNTACTKFIHPSMLAAPIPSNNGQTTNFSTDPSSTTSSQVQCPYCAVKICQNCKGLVHDNECVDEFEGTRAAANPANSRQCSRCGNLVERTAGCQHMNCECGHQFCLLCGADWSVCQGSCERSTEDAIANHGEGVPDFTIRQILHILHVHVILERPYLEHIDPESLLEVIQIVDVAVLFAEENTEDLDRPAPGQLTGLFIDVLTSLMFRRWEVRQMPVTMFMANNNTLDLDAFVPLRRFASTRLLAVEAEATETVRALWRRGVDPVWRERVYRDTQAFLLVAADERD